MREESETVRLEAFSDGVFGIAMTLLVIEIKVPSHERVAVQGLGHALIALWPSYLAFLTSFVTILVIWVHHHWVFALISRNDHPFLYWNGPKAGAWPCACSSRYSSRCAARRPPSPAFPMLVDRHVRLAGAVDRARRSSPRNWCMTSAPVSERGRHAICCGLKVAAMVVAITAATA